MDGYNSQPHTATCPSCGAPTQLPFRPFCSRRCTDVDLGRWFNESYRVHTDEKPPEDAASEDETS